MSKLSTKKTKETPVKITLKDLIARKQEIKNKKKEKRDLYIKSLDSVITVLKPDADLCLDSMDMEGNEGNDYLVYNCVVEPNLKDVELHKEYGVEENPMQIVHEIFDNGEVTSIANECLKFSGYVDSVKVVEDIKNV